MQTINIREMKEEDWHCVSRIYKLGIESGISTFERIVPSWEKWDKAHLKECRLIAEKDTAIIGFIALSPVSSRYCYRGIAEISIYVDPQYKKCGVGSKLMSALLKASEQQGLWTLQSTIMETNPASLALHKKLGFRVVGRREKIAKDLKGIWRDTLLVERRNDLY